MVPEPPYGASQSALAAVRSRERVMWFAVWSAIGALYALSVVGALTIGVFVLPVAILVTVVTARHRRSRVGLPGLVSGAALPLVYVGYLNRHGPGTVCSTTRTGQTCTDEWSPWPWLAAAIALVVAGGLAFLRPRGRDDSRR